MTETILQRGRHYKKEKKTATTVMIMPIMKIPYSDGYGE